VNKILPYLLVFAVPLTMILFTTGPPRGLVPDVKAVAVTENSTPTPFQPVKETPPPTPAIKGIPIKVRVSYYWPKLGGPNCSYFVHGQCLSRMASGKPWQNWKNKAIACPPEWSFGTRIIIKDQIWTCMDRGGKIVFEGGIPWIDLLTPKPPSWYRYGKIVEAVLIPK